MVENRRQKRAMDAGNCLCCCSFGIYAWYYFCACRYIVAKPLLSLAKLEVVKALGLTLFHDSMTLQRVKFSLMV